MKLAEEAVAGARAEARDLVPDDLKSLSDDLAAAKDAFAKGDYKAALAAAQAIQQKANDVMAKAKAKKDELTATWTQLADSVPKMVDAIKSRVDILSQSKKLPPGMDAAKLAAAKDGLAAATTAWGEAQEAAQGGQVDRRHRQGAPRSRTRRPRSWPRWGCRRRRAARREVTLSCDSSQKGPRKAGPSLFWRQDPSRRSDLTPTRSSRAAST